MVQWGGRRQQQRNVTWNPSALPICHPCKNVENITKYKGPVFKGSVRNGVTNSQPLFCNLHGQSWANVQGFLNIIHRNESNAHQHGGRITEGVRADVILKRFWGSTYR